MIEVLRLGHRRARDARITTHVCLVARAFGADGVVVAEKDETLEKTVADVVARFGGPFRVRTGQAWKPYVKAWKKRGSVVHLTMYGEPLEGVLGAVRGRDVLVVVGAEKVPGDLYDLADHNVAVGNQPHSEVAAVALALDRLTEGEWARRSFVGPVEIVPNPRGKTLINRTNPPGRRRGTA
ncbi:MAG TPA: tRNA (cytidine(56)-2'-O)-methyltransferase [Candidatus Thermoplasmatota archaeon]|nr:tRNA (cytidine(56)-2'-O)-methyltransferase [Candidatus Thermoplasmatota archaeon]